MLFLLGTAAFAFAAEAVPYKSGNGSADERDADEHGCTTAQQCQDHSTDKFRKILFHDEELLLAFYKCNKFLRFLIVYLCEQQTIMQMVTIIIVAVAALLVLWFVSAQRRLVSKEELCKNAMSQIGVQQSSRWDALTALAELTKSYNEHEYNTIKDVISQRADITSASSAKEVNAQEDMIGSALSRIIAIAEQYPELKANENYAKTMDSVNLYENQVRTSRMVYNDTVTAYNRIVRQFPDSIAASILGFKEKEYLQEIKAKSEMPSMKI